MNGTIAYGKSLWYHGDTIGLNTKVIYKDQNGIEAQINMKKFVELAKKCRKEENKKYFDEWIPIIESNGLRIGVVVIDGLNRMIRELGNMVYDCIEKEVKKENGK